MSVFLTQLTFLLLASKEGTWRDLTEDDIMRITSCDVIIAADGIIISLCDIPFLFSGSHVRFFSGLFILY